MTPPTPALPWCEYWGRTTPSHPAVVAENWRFSYGELCQAVRRRAAVLVTDSGPERPVVLAALPGSREWLLDVLAVLALGRQGVQPDQDWARDAWPTHLARLPDRPPGGVDATQGGLWLFTSGTTQRPRARFRSTRLLADNVAGVLSRLPRRLRAARPTSIAIVPLSHAYGLINTLFLTFALGGTVLMPGGAAPDSVAALLRDYQVDMLYAWPAHIEALADPLLWRRARARPQWCVSSSLQLHPSVAQAFACAVGVPVRQQYGATETGPLCVDDGDPPGIGPGCVGRPLPGVQIRLLGAEEGVTGTGEGEVAVRVPGMALDPGELDASGFWRTRDRGLIDRAGRLHLLGRYQPFTDERGGVSPL